MSQLARYHLRPSTMNPLTSAGGAAPTASNPFGNIDISPTSTISITLRCPEFFNSTPTTISSVHRAPRSLPGFISDYPFSHPIYSNTSAIHLALTYPCGLRLTYVNLLLSKGAPASACSPRDLNTPLHVLSARFPSAINTAIARALVYAPDVKVDAVNSAGCTPLHVAAKHGNLEIIKVLLSAGASVDLGCGNGGTALHLAAKNGREEVVALLLERGARVDIQDGTGATALHIAGRKKGGVVVGIARMLLKAGANVNVQDGEGKSVLHVMAMVGSVECVRMCIERGADLELKDVGGRTAEMLDWMYAMDTVKFEERRKAMAREVRSAMEPSGWEKGWKAPKGVSQHVSV